MDGQEEQQISNVELTRLREGHIRLRFTRRSLKDYPQLF